MEDEIYLYKGEKGLSEFVNKWKEICKPEKVYICNGSEEEKHSLLEEMVAQGKAIKLNEKKRPNSYYFRTDPSDVARVESRTFICCPEQKDAGITNNWVNDQEMKKTLLSLYTGCMEGRTMYVIPFSMGPLSSPYSFLGVEITDSAYVAVHMSVMTRMGQKALERINKGEGFIPCMHSVGMPLKKGEKDSMWPCRPVEEKYICQFPQTMEIFSYGSGYGGNALLGKKCFSLRIASVLGKKQGWLAEHMLIVGITNPKGEKKYMAAAFPSACGKTNLAMIQPSIPGWKAETVGDDICWMHIGKDGYFHAINPEYGLFGVVPFTSDKTNHNAYEAMRKDTLFTNVALTSDGDVWWEGIGYDAPDNMLDWHGNPYDKNSQEPAAHKNSRFTAPITNCPCVSKEFDSPDGVKISALIFGGRRATTVPLVYEAKSWNHGVMIASSVGSEITAATLGLTLGELRLDPFAMKPFCGYNMAHYFGHWIEMGKKIEDSKRPKIFCVNWFRKHDGKFLWPGYAENSRVLEYIFNRCNGKENFVSSPIGLVPAHDALNTKGLDIKQDDLNRALNIDKSEWKAEIEKIEKFYDTFGEDLPKELHVELNKLKVNLYK